MPLRHDCPLTPHVVEELFPQDPQPLISNNVVELLQSQLTDAFETALRQGIQPMDALAVIVSWVSSEMMRSKPDQGSSS